MLGFAKLTHLLCSSPIHRETWVMIGIFEYTEWFLLMMWSCGDNVVFYCTTNLSGYCENTTYGKFSRNCTCTYYSIRTQVWVRLDWCKMTPCVIGPDDEICCKNVTALANLCHSCKIQNTVRSIYCPGILIWDTAFGMQLNY